MENFWDFNVWGTINLVAVLLFSLLTANLLKKTFKFLQASLIPTSVLGGVMLLVISSIYNAITGEVMFDTAFFGGKGMSTMEMITYHTLALGFIATSLKTSEKKLTKKRNVEIFNTGVTTVATYLIQAIFGLGITMIAALLIKDFFAAAGILLPFGYGQGTGQALNYGTIYENDYGFVGGRSFGLTIAALGFLSASIGGVIHLNIIKKKKNLKTAMGDEGKVSSEEVQSDNEIPMNGSMDKLTVQVAFILLSYMLTYLAMLGLGTLLPGMRSVIYGFNFLLGVLAATLVKAGLKFLNKKSVVKKQYTNNFLLTRVGNFCFDIMVVAGIAAIRLDLLKNYWVILLILGVVGLVVTYVYNLFIAKVLFKDYEDEQFLAMYGMLTGTASTGVILLREVDGDFKTPVSDNLVYQNFPAIVFGFPMMLLATLAPKQPLLTFGILVAFFAVMNVILFRSFIFKRKKKKEE
jgi:ESS family glutamate:Na+ symporter